METRNKTIRNISIFASFVILSGWIGRGLDLLLGVSSNESLGTLLWLVTPLFTTLILRGFFDDGWKDIGLNPQLKKNYKWFIIAILIFPFVTIVSSFIGIGLGWIETEFKFKIFFPLFASTLIINFFKNIPEEFVWQGYLTPKLLKLKLNDWVLYLMIGLIWGIWHIPYYLYFLSREDLTNFTSLNLGVFIPISIIVMTLWAITFVELRRLTNSVWPVVVLHTVEDGLNILFIHNYLQIDQSKEMIISPIYGVVGICLHVLIGLSLRNVRRKKEKKIYCHH